MTKSSSRQPDTRLQIVGAALETVKQVGFAGATSRAIARTGGFNQALIFYHFGSLDSLLLAALDHTSEQRLARYRAALEEATTAEELVSVATRLYEEDRAGGHTTVVSQLIAGSVARPELAPQVLARMEPWLELCETALGRLADELGLRAVVPLPELAYAAATFFLGVNLLTHLDPEGNRTDALFERLRELLPLLAALRR